MRLVRYGLAVVIVALIGIGIAIPASTFIAPRLGYELFAIRGQSMSPTIPMGALIVTSKALVSELEPGDVVTWRGDNGVVVTHRVVRVVTDGAGPAVLTQGDANATADPSPVPERAIIGDVDAWIPLAGFAMILLGTPSGLISWLSFGLALIVIDTFVLAAQTPGGPRPQRGPTLAHRLRSRGRRAQGTGWPIHYEGVTVCGDDLAILDDMLRCSEGDHRTCVTEIRPRACVISQPDWAQVAA